MLGTRESISASANGIAPAANGNQSCPQSTLLDTAVSMLLAREPLLFIIVR